LTKASSTDKIFLSSPITRYGQIFYENHTQPFPDDARE
jgi:hypothetical protein